MNKRFSIRVCAALAALLLPFSLRADTETVNGITWTYTISDGKASVGGGSSSLTAVPKSTLGSITIPSTLGGYPVTSVGHIAFCGCSGLTLVTIPSSVTSIGDYAFDSCWGLTSVTIPNSVTSIGYAAFAGCSGLTSATIPDSVTSIGDAAFNFCSGLTSVTIPNSVTRIGEEAFRFCDGLTSVTIPDSVTRIGDRAFANCGGLKSFTVGAGNPIYCSVNGLLLSRDCKSLILGINGVVAIPNSVTSIEDYAFEGCWGLTSVTIPNSVTRIGKEAFTFCDGLTSVTIPDSVTRIGDEAFAYCDGLTSVALGNSVTRIGDRAFAWSEGLKSFSVSAGNPIYCSVNGLLLSRDCKSLILGVNGAVRIPNTVTRIGDSAFKGCGGLTSVTIPNSVTTIGDSAFCGCGLTSVTIPNSVTRIGARAFSWCERLRSVAIPDSVINIGKAAFTWCKVLNSFAVGAKNPSYCSVKGLLLSKDRKALKNGVAGAVRIPNTVTSIKDYAFEGCWGLMSVTIPNSVTSIGNSAFWGCEGLSSVTIPNSVTSIGNNAFWGCSGLKTLYLPSHFKGRTSGLNIPSDCQIVFYSANYKVIFNANGGKLPKGKKMAAQSMTYGTAAKLRKNVFTRSGWVFAGWAVTKADAKKSLIAYTNAQSVKNLRTDGKTTMLYAVWAKKTYKVAFYANGGKGTMAVEKFTYGKAKKLSANKFKAPKGKKFAGWAKSKPLAKKGKVAYKNKKKVKNLVTNGKTVKLYAVWKKK